MKVVLNNVIGNAMKYNDSTKAEQRILVTAEKNNNHLKIQIEDNGIGIEPQHLPKVFDMFYRASENSKGSGLGLYIVKETVSTLQGTIEVNSIMGKGSEFVIEIPMLS
jgi:signal transduction histidine kinase